LQGKFYPKKKAIEGDETLTNSIKQSTQQKGEKKDQRKRERDKTQVHQTRRAKPKEREFNAEK
jgi:hypothetical protein